jgi:hypothetical protein
MWRIPLSFPTRTIQLFAISTFPRALKSRNAHNGGVGPTGCFTVKVCTSTKPAFSSLVFNCSATTRFNAPKTAAHRRRDAEEGLQTPRG